jgi:hypothetical protein
MMVIAPNGEPEDPGAALPGATTPRLVTFQVTLP